MSVLAQLIGILIKIGFGYISLDIVIRKKLWIVLKVSTQLIVNFPPVPDVLVKLIRILTIIG